MNMTLSQKTNKRYGTAPSASSSSSFRGNLREMFLHFLQLFYPEESFSGNSDNLEGFNRLCKIFYGFPESGLPEFLAYVVGLSFL